MDDSKPRSYKELMNYIANNLIKDDLSRAKYFLKGEISEGELEKITTSLELIETMERNNILSKENTKTLKTTLEGIHRKDLASKITELKEKRQSEGMLVEQPRPVSVDVEPVVPYFVETSYCHELDDGMRKGNMVILKGVAASGKSQLAFWYASKFKEGNPNSVICKLQCTSLDELLQSMQNLLISLKVSFESKETEKENYIQQMNEMARDKLCREKFRDSRHLLIFNDIKCPKIVTRILTSLRGEDHLKIICTTDNDAFFALESKQLKNTIIHVKGVKEDEVLKFFPIQCNQQTMKKGEETALLSDLKRLACELDYLPLSLICAECYMQKTHVDVKGYLERLKKHGMFLEHVDSVLKDEMHNYSKGLVAALKTSLDNVTLDANPEYVSMLKMMQFLDKNDIPRTLLLCLLPDISEYAEKEILVDAMIAKLKQYSLCVIQGSGNDSQLSIHAMTRHVMLSTMSDDEKTNLLKKLMYVFCGNMNVDARCKDVLKKNLCFRRHAQIVLKKCQKHFQNVEEDVEIKLLNFCLATLIGVTFCQYGNEDLMAEEYLKKAKTLLFSLAEINYEDIESAIREKHFSPLQDREHDVSSEKDSWPWIMKLFGTGHVAKDEDNVENRAIANLFEKLVSKGNIIPDGFLEKVIIQTVRSSQDMEHIKTAAQRSGMSKTEICKCGKFQLTVQFFEEMVKKGLAKPMKMIKKVFLVESLIIISYSNAKNLYKWKFKDDVALTQRQCDFRLSFLLGKELRKKLPEYTSVYYLVTQRNSLLYYVETNIKNSTTDEKIKRLNEAIQRFKELLKVQENYFEFGIIKLGTWHSPHNRGMCLQHLVRCHSELYTLYKKEKEKEKEKNEIHKKGSDYRQQLETQANKMYEHWIATSGFHFCIGKFYKTAETGYDLELAIHHFKKSIEQHEEFEKYGVSHVYLEASFELVECFIHLGDGESLLKGKKICESLIASLHESNKPDFLHRAQQALDKITQSISN